MIYGLPQSCGSPIQDWAIQFGLGKPTGIEIGDVAGVVPTRKWQRNHYTAPRTRIWKPGDSLNLAIGQKDLQVTPLQMTRLYAAIATGKIAVPAPAPLGRARRHGHRPGVAPAPSPIDPGAVFNEYLTSSATGSTWPPTPRDGTSAAGLRQLPGPDRGQDRDGREVVGQYPAELQPEPGGAATGRSTSPARGSPSAP